MDECARIMLTEVGKCNLAGTTLEKVIFVLLSESHYQTLNQEKEWLERRKTISDGEVES